MPEKKAKEKTPEERYKSLVKHLGKENVDALYGFLKKVKPDKMRR